MDLLSVPPIRMIQVLRVIATTHLSIGKMMLNLKSYGHIPISNFLFLG